MQNIRQEGNSKTFWFGLRTCSRNMFVCCFFQGGGRKTEIRRLWEDFFGGEAGGVLLLLSLFLKQARRWAIKTEERHRGPQASKQASNERTNERKKSPMDHASRTKDYSFKRSDENPHLNFHMDCWIRDTRWSCVRACVWRERAGLIYIHLARAGGSGDMIGLSGLLKRVRDGVDGWMERKKEGKKAGERTR